MTVYAKRTITGTLTCLLASGLVIAEHVHYRGVLPNLNYLTGWLLLTVMFLLTIYNARKKLPFLPLGRSETWLNFHLYAGLFTVALFLVHLNYRLPQSRFGILFGLVYVLVAASGIWGWFLSRSIPKRLTTRGGDVLFERIPTIRRGLQEQAEALAMQSIRDSHSPTIANFYTTQLREFFAGPQNVALHWFEIRRPVNILLNRIGDLNRYLNKKEQETLEKIADLVRQKDGLDYHYALQISLKTWLFVHIPLTYSLLIFTLAHLVVVYAFAGGTR